MLDDEGNLWPRGRLISFDGGMGGYIPYDIDQLHVIPQAAALAGPRTKESAKVLERFLLSKSPGEDRLVVQKVEQLRRQTNKAAKEQLEQDCAAAFSQEMQQ